MRTMACWCDICDVRANAAMKPRKLQDNRMSMKRAALAAAVLAFIGGTALAEGVSLAVVNNSSKNIYHLYLSPANDNNWGPDQMGDTQDDTVAPGDSFTLTDIDPGKYD